MSQIKFRSIRSTMFVFGGTGRPLPSASCCRRCITGKLAGAADRADADHRPRRRARRWIHDAYRAFWPGSAEGALSRTANGTRHQVEAVAWRGCSMSPSTPSPTGDGADLKALLDEGPDRVRAFYLAVGPALFGDISERIRRDPGLVTGQTRIVGWKKPIGRDLQSAKVLKTGPSARCSRKEPGPTASTIIWARKNGART